MKLRASNIARLKQQPFDVLIVGGGINGAVAASSLAAKGVPVALVDRGDFAGLTSSNSSNLAWGGIKYLESGELLLVDKLCRSRNHLMRHYPSRVKEIRFLTTIAKGFRKPVWMIYLGTLLYWAIGRFATRPPRYLSARQIAASEPVVDTRNARAGFEYSDCYLHDNDSRFVFGFIRDSLNHGCVGANYVELTSARRSGDHWECRLRDNMTSASWTTRCRLLINACGPYTDAVNQQLAQHTRHRHLFSKGVHLIVDRVTEHRRVLTFFASDGRLFFILPMGPRTCIGTTDTQVDDPATGITEQDRQFLLDNANALLKLPRPLQVSDIIAERCGVRPLAVSGEDNTADWVQLSRKHSIECDPARQHISIFGGKLTDCLNVGDEIARAVGNMGIEVPYARKKWYGEPDKSIRDAFFHQARLMQLDQYTAPDTFEPLSERFWRRYAAYAFLLLDRIREDASQAEPLIANTDYLRCELELAARREMITRLEDFMRRRSKIELVLRREEILAAPGLEEVCRILFGDAAQERLQEYIDGAYD